MTPSETPPKPAKKPRPAHYDYPDWPMTPGYGPGHDFRVEAVEMCLAGARHRDVMEQFNIGSTTLYRWMRACRGAGAKRQQKRLTATTPNPER